MAFLYNAWTFGAEYAYRQDTFTSRSSISGRTKKERAQQGAVLTVDYVLCPGINLNAEVAYTWRDFDQTPSPSPPATILKARGRHQRSPGRSPESGIFP